MSFSLQQPKFGAAYFFPQPYLNDVLRQHMVQVTQNPDIFDSQKASSHIIEHPDLGPGRLILTAEHKSTQDISNLPDLSHKVRQALQVFGTPIKSVTSQQPNSSLSSQKLEGSMANILRENKDNLKPIQPRYLENTKFMPHQNSNGQPMWYVLINLENPNKALGIPAVDRFQSRQDFLTYYTNTFNCINPQSGQLFLKSPMELEWDSSQNTWNIVKKGELEVKPW